MGHSLIPSMPWLTPIYQTLLGMYGQRQGHHALLISCSKGMGEDILIKAMASYLLCQNQSIDRLSVICGSCPSCLLMSAGNHPDYHIIEPEKDKKQIGIDIIRLMTEKLYQHANQGGAKIVQILQLETMTHAAMNALLKILEEPPEKTYFLLSTYAPDTLLATIKSRCLNFPIAKIDQKITLEWLKKEFSEREDTLLVALKIAQGGPLLAKSLLADDSLVQRANFLNDFKIAATDNKPINLLAHLLRDNWLFYFDCLLSLVHDARKYQSMISFKQGEINSIDGQALFINSDVLSLVKDLSHKEPLFLQAIIQNGIHLRNLLLNNSGLNLELLMSDFLLKWQEKKLELLSI